jgi:hypothetical protein
MRLKFRSTDAKQTDANKEFERQRRTEWQWFMVALIGFTIIGFLYLSISG